MNPFNFDSQYDEHLANLISKINKSSVLNVNDTIKELIIYLPKSNYHSDYHIILKTLKPLFSSPGKPLINKILYFLAKNIGSECLESIMIEWIYENFDSKDPYSEGIIDKYVDFSLFSVKCLKALTWSDYLKDLQLFKFLLFKTPCANTKNNEIYLNFDISKLSLTTYFELDLIFEILKELKNRNPIEFLKFNSTETDVEKQPFIDKIFNSIKDLKNPILLNKKYKILIEIFDFIGESIYEDAHNLDLDLFTKLLSKNLIFENIKISTVDQLSLILPKIQNKESYLLNNINKKMCIFQLLEKINIIENLIYQNENVFSEIVNESMKRHFIYKTCLDRYSSEFYSQKIGIFFDLVTEKNRIIAASILGKKLEHDLFSVKEIDEVMSYSVNVFPLEFFLKRRFNSSAIHLLQKYPELCSKKYLKSIIENFSKTTPEQLIKVIDDIETLTFYLESLPIATIKNLCQINSKPLLKIVYLFYLRDEIEQFNVDYSIVFEYFLEKNFLVYLLNSKNNIENFFECSIEYIKDLNIQNSIFYNDYNFDSDEQFYYNIDHSKGIPDRNEALYAICTALQASKNSDLLLEVFQHLIEIILYIPCVISEKLKLKLLESDFVESINEKFKLQKNDFILKRFLMEFVQFHRPEIKNSVLEINHLKAVDVILRNLIIPQNYLTALNPSYISNQSLNHVICMILDNSIKNIKLRSTNKIQSLKLLDNQPEFENSKTEINEAIENLQISNQESLIEANEHLNSNLDTSKSSELVAFVEKFLKPATVHSVLDFLYLLENDLILAQKPYRSERLNIYLPLIQAISLVFSESILNLYSITKSEKKQDNDTVFEMVFTQFRNLKNSFWIILFNTVMKTNNIFFSFFIEERILKYLNINTKNFLNTNDIIPLSSYLKICSPQEFTCFALAFPNIYSKYKIKHTIDMENYLLSTTNIKVDNGKITCTKSGDFYKLKLNYMADSLIHTAVISIPINYPYSKSRIEFEKDQKSIKFYHKLNEILNRTSKFTEIFFLWKIDIDNRLIGHSECLICYFIMDPKYKQLPTFPCKTCKNIFHEKCIFKWASQSKRSECPFCRSDLQIWSKEN